MRQFVSYEEENIHYWTHRAPGYSGVNQEELATDQKRVWGRAIGERIAARFPGRGPESIRVLDVGTGPGFFAIILAQMGYQVTAVDYTASMLEEARRNAGALAGKIDFQRMNAEELLFAEHSFDVLVTRNLTWNLPNPEKAYGQWVRALAPGGLLLNFDANWYRYLWDEEAKLGHSQDREKLAAADGVVTDRKYQEHGGNVGIVPVPLPVFSAEDPLNHFEGGADGDEADGDD